MMRSLIKLYCKVRYRVQVKYLEKMPDGGVLYLPLFTSALDPVLAALFLPGNPRLAIPRYAVANWPGWLLRAIDPILLETGESNSLREFIHLLRSGKRGVFFPEERQAADGQLGKLHRSLAMIVEQSNTTLLPVRFSGAEHSKYSLTANKEHAPLRFAPIKLLLGEGQSLENAEARGKDRRKDTSRVLWQMMRDFKFLTEWRHQTVFDACLETRRQWGGSHLAVIDPDFTEVSWNQLLARVLLFCDAFSSWLTPKERVGILLPNSAHAVATFLALHRCSATPAMLNYSVGVQALLSACKTAHIRRVITSRRFLDAGKFTHLATALEEDGKQLVYLEDLAAAITPFKKIVALLKGMWLSPSGRPGAEKEIAVILFTSGSEGTPKGVALSHLNVQADCVHITSGVNFSCKERILNSMPMFHSFGLCCATLSPLIVGMPVMLYPTPLHFKIIPSMAYIARCTIMLGSNAFLSGYAKNAYPIELSYIRTAVCGGDQLKESTYDLWLRKFGVRIVEGYGVTECSPVISFNVKEAHALGSVGVLVPGIEARLSPIEGVAEGGSLQIKGPNVMLGYLREDAPEQFKAPEEGWYDTGDVVSIDEQGVLRIQGRLKRFAKIGGEMLSLATVEDVVQQCWPDFAHAVISVPDETRGEVLLLATEMKSLKRDEIRSAFKEQGLPEIAIPKQILYLDELPRVGVGKADYIKIKSIALQEQA